MRRVCSFFLFLLLSLSFVYGQQIVYFTENEKIEILNAHNHERNLVGNADLTWDRNLELFAADRAKTLAERDNGLSHRPNNSYGENCYWTSSNHINATEAILAFNDEKNDYQYGPVTNSNYKVTGHYTQVIWYNTTKVGCAGATGTGGTFVVCNYNPPGNYLGDYPYAGNRVSNRSNEIYNDNSIQQSNQINSNNPDYIHQQSSHALNSNNFDGINGASHSNSQLPSISSVHTTQRNTKSANDKTNNTIRQERESAVVLFSGLEVWTKFNNSPVLPRIKQRNTMDFTGGSPSFWVKSTLPRAKSKNLSDVRLYLSLGVTLNNSVRQADLVYQTSLPQTSLRIYSPLNYEIGFKCLNISMWVLGEFLLEIKVRLTKSMLCTLID